MRIAVVDDERPARSELKYLVEQCEPDAEIAEADGSEEFLAVLENETLDVCFVDINLGGMNGTTLASMIKRKQPDTLIIFATAFQEYAVKAFEIGAVDYLLKPFDYERVKRAMERIHEMCIRDREKGVGKVIVNVKREERSTRIDVIDNGPGMDYRIVQSLYGGEKVEHTGIGMMNVQQRLISLYGKSYGLQIVTSEEGRCV